MRFMDDADLRQLAELESTERAFVSCYLCPSGERDWLMRREKAIEHLLEEQPDNLEHFQEGMLMVHEWLAEQHTDQPALCVFACFALDLVQGYALPVEVDRLLRLGPAPLIRPLAEIEDEHEDFVFVTADNDAAEIHFVSTAIIRQRERIKGDVKNHVKKGGWSQKRYQRRRENELMHYAKDVVEQLEALHGKRAFSRLVLLGSQEARNAITDQLPEPLQQVLVGEDGADLNDDEMALFEEARAYVERAEQREERSLWKRIEAELLSGGLAEAGAEDVWLALANGRAEQLMLTRDLALRGHKCRQCENVTARQDVRECAFCHSDDTFDIDLVDALVRQAERTSADVEFVDAFAALTRLGGVAALLRY